MMVSHEPVKGHRVYQYKPGSDPRYGCQCGASLCNLTEVAEHWNEAER